jgi:hypothetical protein
VEGDGGRRPHPAFGERQLGRDVRVEVMREQADVDLLVAVFTLNGRVGVAEDVRPSLSIATATPYSGRHPTQRLPERMPNALRGTHGKRYPEAVPAHN